eukprot:6315557-Heterocapsa_arctica.AAC.1
MNKDKKDEEESISDVAVEAAEMNSGKKDEEESISDVAAEAAEMKDTENQHVTVQAAEANNNI